MLLRPAVRISRYVCFGLIVLFLPGAVRVLGQEQPAKSNSAATTSAERQIANDKIRVPKGTRVRLILLQTISSKTAQKGDAVALQVLDPVEVDNLVVIAKKTAVKATITAAHPAQRAWRAGSLALQMEFVAMVDQQKVALQAGRSAQGEATQPDLGAPQLLPLAPLIIPLEALSHGNEGIFPKGQFSLRKLATRSCSTGLPLRPLSLSRLLQKSKATKLPSRFIGWASGVAPSR